MRRLHPAVLTVFLILSTDDAAALLFAGKPFARASSSTIDLGRRIFNHNWARPESWTGPEKLGKGGDGLGPMFNDVSCAACHRDGGVGGGGGNEHNAEMLNADLRSSPIIGVRMKMLEQAHEIHPMLSPTQASVVLHHFGFGPEGDELEYQEFRDNLKSRVMESKRDPEMDPPNSVGGRLVLEFAERNTTALWGLGKIEHIRVSGGDKEREQLIDWQRQMQTGVTGRLPRTPTGGLGWYGWRGQAGDLRAFVSGACANELGLEVAGNAQSDNPLHPSRSRSTSLKPDLTERQVTALTAFVANLPSPVQVFPRDLNARQVAENGESLFHEIGCSICHVRNLGNVEGIYSDLLLHDMGLRTSDRASAYPGRTGGTDMNKRMSDGYYGGDDLISSTLSQRVPTKLDQEWRTPPLWGSADSAPYLHDGRAETFHDAIEMHEGEASGSAEEYRRLSDEQRSSLLSFLDTLRAPVISDAE